MTFDAEDSETVTTSLATVQEVSLLLLIIFFATVDGSTELDCLEFERWTTILSVFQTFNRVFSISCNRFHCAVTFNRLHTGHMLA